MAWFENTGTTWIRHSLSTKQNCHHLAFGDLNADGLEDIACAGGSNPYVFWLERPSNVTNTWPDHVLDSRAVWGAKVADIDRDGNLDVVAGRAWYRNPGPGGPQTNWQRYPYTLRQDTATHTQGWAASKFNDYEELSVLDLNGDGRLDIVAALFSGSPEGEVSAFLAPADPLTGSWQEVRLDTGPLFSVHTIAVGDFDGTGRPQVAVGEMAWAGYNFGHNPGTTDIFVYRLEGPASDPASWTRSTIASDDIGTHAADAIDIDGDGRLDLISGEENSGNGNPVQNGRPRWWENQTAGPATVEPVNTAPPELCTGCTWQEGDQVSATDGAWQGATSFDRQWYSCDPDGSSNCQPIAGATTNQLTLGTAQVDHTILFEETASNEAGSTTAESAPSPLVAAAPSDPVDTAPPELCTGCTWQEGDQVSATDGSWQGATSFDRQWYGCDPDGSSNCQPIAGATTNQLTLGTAQVDHTILFEVIAGNGSGSTTARSGASAVVVAAPPPNLAPDPSFEISPTTYYFANGAGKAVVTSAASHSGQQSWQITGKGSGATRVISRYKEVSAQPGATYEASAWFQLAGVGKNALLAMNFWSASGARLGSTKLSPKLSGSQSWASVSIQGVAPAKTAYVRVEAKLTGTGTLWYDDVSIVPIG